ncbi:MAG TPA: glycosyltransferase, partial [Flavobacterium sp.]|nr:glycosyltransferase [Flavobacterium sp.]
AMRYWPVIPALMGVMDNVSTGHHAHFRHSAGKNRRVIFSSKLWRPENVSDPEKKAQREAINQERIDLVRELRHVLGDNFVGGIREDELSRELSPDLLLDSRQSHKAYYRRVLAGCGIGVANAGLEDSIGFKFAEYVANGSALLSNDISKYVLPGKFREGEHYLTYRDVPDCVYKVRQLLSNDDVRIAMGKANERYYDEVLEPATNMKRIIDCVLGDLRFKG